MGGAEARPCEQYGLRPWTVLEGPSGQTGMGGGAVHETETKKRLIKEATE